jgi:hypothetical protein
VARKRKEDRDELAVIDLVACVTPAQAREARKLAAAEGRSVSGLIRWLLQQRLAQRTEANE